MFIPIGDDNRQREITPFVTWLILAINCAMWCIQLTAGESFTYGYSTVPYEITHNVDLASAVAAGHGRNAPVIPQAPGPSPIYLTLLSAMFMHGSWMHIIGNMVYLVIFADQIEDLLGHFKFAIFYLACGIGAGAAQIYAEPNSLIPCLGASGAIAGVLGAYLVKYPMNPVHVLVIRFVTSMPAFVVLGFWIVLQLFAQVTLAGQQSGVAYMAHIGGFAAGLALVFLLPKRARVRSFT